MKMVLEARTLPSRVNFQVKSAAQQILGCECQEMLNRLAAVLLCNVAMKINATKINKRKSRITPVIVIGAGFRCMAFRDARGMLRNFWNQSLLPLPVHFLDPED